MTATELIETLCKIIALQARVIDELNKLLRQYELSQ